MKVKTNELVGDILDWVVAAVWLPDAGLPESLRTAAMVGWLAEGSPSRDWKQAGPLIEKRITCIVDTEDGCYADTWAKAGAYGKALTEFDGYGPTILVAVMRAIVASELGDEVEVDVPEELVT